MGSKVWTTQFASAGYMPGRSVVAGLDGISVYVAGYTTAVFDNQVYLGLDDAFAMKISSCPAGCYCNLLYAQPVPCPPGTYNPGIELASAASCLVCPAGTYSPRVGANLNSIMFELFCGKLLPSKLILAASLRCRVFLCHSSHPSCVHCRQLLFARIHFTESMCCWIFLHNYGHSG